MSTRNVSGGAKVVIGVATALVAGLIGSTVIVRAAAAEPHRPAVPAAVARPHTVAARPEPAPTPREEPVPAFDRLVLVGDSLAGEAAPVIRDLTPGRTFVERFHGGTAPCDWVDADLPVTPATVMVITFSGNSLTPCMLDETGARLVGQPLLDKYRTDVGGLIDRATDAGAWVVLVGQPRSHPRFATEATIEGLDAVYREYAAARPHVSYVDAGSNVELPDGAYANRLPCAEFDQDCGPDGTTVVRGDGVHFCPVAGVSPCPVWSGGAFRFGLGVAAGANDPELFD